MPIFTITEEEKEKENIIRFEDEKISGITLQSKLMKLGWYRGLVQDAGIFYKSGTSRRGHYVYKDVYEGRRILPKQIPKKFLSTILYHI